MIKKSILIAFVILSLFACSHQDKLVLRPASYEELPGWGKDKYKNALKTFNISCTRFSKQKPENKIHTSGVGGEIAKWQDICNKAAITPKNDASAREFFEKNFAPFSVKNGSKEKGLFTGYYEASLEASRKKHGIYIYPIYAKPKNLGLGQKYFTRKEIELGALAGQQLELFYVSDKVELFFLQIQGSGVLHLDSGEYVRVGYAGQNGYPYTPIGKHLIKTNEIKKEDMSAQAIKNWLRKNNTQADKVMDLNESYVFFREVVGKGPIGGAGVPLTKWRSLAVDKNFIPYGAPLWLNVNFKSINGQNKNTSRLMVAQDTGGAIKGPIRGDIFFGRGQKAENYASSQNSEGSYFMLLPK